MDFYAHRVYLSRLRDRSYGWVGLREDHLIFRRTKGGSVVTWSPKGRITENFGRIQEGTTQICLENGDIGAES